MNRFTIDFFEFSFLVEACIPPRPIARSMFWHNVIDKYYHIMTSEERKSLFEWITKNSIFTINNNDCALFHARFNPDNQYIVTTVYNNEEKLNYCFKWKDRYHISSNTSLLNRYITKIDKQ